MKLSESGTLKQANAWRFLKATLILLDQQISIMMTHWFSLLALIVQYESGTRKQAIAWGCLKVTLILLDQQLSTRMGHSLYPQAGMDLSESGILYPVYVWM